MPKGKQRRLWLSVVRRTPLANNKTLRLDDNKGVVVSYKLLPEPAAERAFDILWALKDGAVLTDCAQEAQAAAAHLLKHKHWLSFTSVLTYTKTEASGSRVLYYEPKVVGAK
jgi:hypothetical protein